MTDISALSLKSTPASDDEIEIQETGGGASKKITPAGLDSSSLTGLVADAITWTGAHSFTSNFAVRSTDAGTGAGPVLNVTRDSASPAGSDLLGQIAFNGENDASEQIKYGSFNGAIDTVTDGAEDGRVDIRTFVSGAQARRMYVAAGVVVGSPTGGDPGAGILNAVEVQDDGVTLTDYPFDAHLDGVIDLDAYDAAVPDREIPEHRETRQVTRTVQRQRLVFEGEGQNRKARVVTMAEEVPVTRTVPVVDDKDDPVLDENGKPMTVEEPVTEEVVTPGRTEVRQHDMARAFDVAELDPLQYSAKFNALRKLPAVSRVVPAQNGKLGAGKLITALTETCEVQAIHIEKLEARIAALESV